ncbi:MAG TPA: GNAT family N-acetyltransferase [bacterium]|nr:GNAT family N-acetyltransferase [bacterium]
MELVPYSPRHAPLIAAWIPDTQTLGLLTYEATGAITPDLVSRWATEAEAAFTLHPDLGSLPVGFGTLMRDPQMGSLWASYVLVDPRERGRGYGWTLIQALGNSAMARGEDRLWAAVVSHNDYARALLGAMGFAAIGTRTLVDPGSTAVVQVSDFMAGLPLPQYKPRGHDIPTPGDEPGYGRGLRSGASN